MEKAIRFRSALMLIIITGMIKKYKKKRVTVEREAMTKKGEQFDL